MNTTQIGNVPVKLWLDPVCPFSWNTARWLTGVADEVGVEIEWHLMSLAELNAGRELPPPMQARMEDSRQIGRLMAAIRSELGVTGLLKAYFRFGERYFDEGAPVGEDLAADLLDVAGAQETTPSSMWNSDLDLVVLQSHQESQQALGETGGSPMLTIGGRTFFGPVLTAAPERHSGRSLFDAIAVLAATPEFSQLQRPRAHS